MHARLSLSLSLSLFKYTISSLNMLTIIFQNRRLHASSTNVVETFLNLNVYAWRIRDYMCGITGKKLTAKDIHNARQRARGMSDSQEEQLLRVLEEIVENEP